MIRSMLFADVRGFSALPDDLLPIFGQVILGSFANVLVPYRPAIEYTNTWGDALFAVFSDVVSAARCALDLQAQLTSERLTDSGLPPELALRASCHVGPIFRFEDPVVARWSYLGGHINRVARLEPVTPPGAVFVTEQFAAALEMAQAADLGFDYVGHLPAAKDYGYLRMYRLRASQVT